MGKAEDTAEEKANWHWRNSMKPVLFFGIDARAAIPFFILIFYFRLTSFAIAVISTLVFVAMEKRGLTFPCALRAFRSWFNGQHRPAWMSIRRRRFIDFG